MNANTRRIGLGLVPLGMILLIGCAGPTGQAEPHGISSYVRGALAADTGDQDKAIAALSTAIAENPNLTMARIRLGDIYRTREEYVKSSQQYEVVVKLDPYDPKNHYHLGLAYQFLSRLEEAAVSYLRSLKLNPKDADANMHLGLVYLALGKPETAITYLRLATTLDPKSAAGFANYGVGLSSLGSLAEAESAYHKSLDLNADQPAVILNLGALLIQQNKATEAIAVMERAVKQSNTAMAHKRYGDALALGRQYAKALAEYRTALKLDRRYYPAINGLGSVYLTQFKEGSELDESLRQSAVDCWKQSLKLNSSQPRITALLKQWDSKPRK